MFSTDNIYSDAVCTGIRNEEREILFCHQIYDDSGDYLIYYKYVVLKSTYMSDGRLSLFCLYYLYILTSLVRSCTDRSVPFHDQYKRSGWKFYLFWPLWIRYSITKSRGNFIILFINFLLWYVYEVIKYYSFLKYKPYKKNCVGKNRSLV